MADTKITALAAITTVDPAADVLPIVDVSDHSMAASGTTKNITTNQILGAGGTATLASATITGAATVGTTLGVTGAATVGTTLLVGTNATLTNGNVILGTSGKGIDFSATPNSGGTMTSELLNDYEEGTFTPTVVGSTTAGTATYSAGAQNGYYTKVGRLVTVQVYMVWSGHTGTGNMRFAGLPFTTANITSNYSSVAFGLVSNIALTAGNILTGHTELNNSFINVLQTPVGGGSYTLVPIDPAGEVLFTCSYIAA